jgi:hypothetical protein
MKKILIFILAVVSLILLSAVVGQKQYTPGDTTMMPVEPDGGIGDGALPLVEFQNLTEDSEEPTEEQRVPQREICVGEYCDGSMSGEQNFTVVNIPLITDGGDVGCGADLFFAPHVVAPSTPAVLDATYRTLFSLKESSEVPSDNIRNVIAREQLLFYDSVRLEDTVATLYLEGSLSSIAHCAVPEFRAQIEQAALQFGTVDTLEVYLNNERFNWCEYSDADPSESGCDMDPKYWIAS